MGARQEDLRTALFAAHVIDIGADAVTGAEGFARQRFITPHNAFATAEIDDHIAVFRTLYRAIDDFADAVLVFGIHPVTLGIAHLLHDDLLGALRGNAAKFDGRQRFGDEIANLRCRILLRGFSQRDLRGFIVELLDHLQQAVEARLAGARIDFGADLVFGHHSAAWQHG